MDEVGAVFREEHPTGDFPDLVAGTADPLQAAGDGWRRLDLHHQVDLSHVDSQLKRRRRDNAAEAARFQVVFDDGALVFTHRAVMRAGQELRRSRAGAGCARHDCGHPTRPRAGCNARRHEPLDPLRDRLREVSFRVQLVQPPSEALGQAPGVDEDDGRPVLKDQVDDAFLNVRPDRSLRSGARLRAVDLGCRAELAHIVDRDHDPQVESLRRPRGDDRHGCDAAQEPRHLLARSNGSRQADALGGLRQQGIQPLQGDREMGTPFGRGDGVHLVDDHGFDAQQGLACGRRKHEVQRFGRGDEDVRGEARKQPTILRRRVARSHSDRNVGRGQSQSLRCLRHTHEG